MKRSGILFIVLMVLGQITPTVQAHSIAYQDKYITIEYTKIKNGYYVKIRVENDGSLVLKWEGDLPCLRRLPHIRGCHTILARRSELNICNFKAYKCKGRIHILVDYTLMNYIVDVVLPRK